MKLILKIALFIALVWAFAAVMSYSMPIVTPQVQDKVLATDALIAQDFVPNATSTALVALTNKDRGTPLQESETLMRDAQNRASYFCNHSFEHFSKDGVTPWMFFTMYDYVHAGENLGKGYATPTKLESAFMASSGHRANIINPVYTDIGVGWMCGVTVVLFGSK